MVHVEVDRCYTKVGRMTRSEVKVKVTEVRKLQKWPISKSVSPIGMDVM